MGSIINIYTKTLQEKDHANRDPQQARASSSVAASYLYGYLYVYRYSQYENRYLRNRSKKIPAVTVASNERQHFGYALVVEARGGKKRL